MGRNLVCCYKRSFKSIIAIVNFLTSYFKMYYRNLNFLINFVKKNKIVLIGSIIQNLNGDLLTTIIK